MRFSLLMTLGLLGLLGVAFAQATADPTITVPIDGLGLVHVNPSALTLPVTMVLIVMMGIRNLPAILAAWKPSVRIEHIHVLKGMGGDTLSRCDIEKLIAASLRERDG